MYFSDDPRHIDNVRASHAAYQAEEEMYRDIAREIDGPPPPGIGTEYGIGQLPEPCWTIVMADGTEFDPTGCWSPGHYATNTEAEQGLLDLATEDRPAPFMEPRREEFRCTTLILVCGTPFIYQGDEDTAHFVDERNLRDCLEVSGCGGSRRQPVRRPVVLWHLHPIDRGKRRRQPEAGAGPDPRVRATRGVHSGHHRRRGGIVSDERPGIPAYSTQDLIAMAGMATTTMLRGRRLRPGDGQQPVGQYWTGHAWVMLYRAEDAVELPPMSPGRQRLWDKNRTCAMCSATRPTPWPKGRDGERYCGTCQRPAAIRLWNREREADRPAIIEWANGVLADPTAFLAFRQRLPYWNRDLAVDLNGTVLLDVQIRHNVKEPYEDHPHRQELLERSPLAAIDQIEKLHGRRMISWWPTTAPDLTTSFDENGWPTAAVAKIAKGDAFGSWYDRWIGEIGDPHYYLAVRPNLKRHLPPADADECIAKMLETITEMAADGPPDTGA